GGVFFLFVAFLQISLAWSPLAAGAASLPITVLMLAFSARSGALAQKVGPRIPLTLGPLVIAAGMLLMTRIDPGDSYVGSVLPAMLVFGAGLTLVVAPITATVLAAADARHAGIASGVNNAVSRVAGLLAVAVLPLVGGLTGDAFYDPPQMTDGFHVAMFATAALSALGGAIAWLTIDPHVLEPEPEAPPHYQCPVSGAPLRADQEEAEPARA
ncbi:MAG TPA: MFS transporter, partial [Conexibacter sp.]|nr:MFS transporter [Conexibacter sp.]